MNITYTNSYNAFVNILTSDRQGKISIMVYEVRGRKKFSNEGDDMKLELENLG